VYQILPDLWDRLVKGVPKEVAALNYVISKSKKGGWSEVVVVVLMCSLVGAGLPQS